MFAWLGLFMEHRTLVQRSSQTNENLARRLSNLVMWHSAASSKTVEHFGRAPLVVQPEDEAETRGALPEKVINSQKVDFSAGSKFFEWCLSGKSSWPSTKLEDTMAIPLGQGALSFFAGVYDKLQTLSCVVQPGTVLIGHDWLPNELVGWVLNTSRRGVQVLRGHVKKSDGNRGTSEISDGEKCFEPWYVQDLDKWQTPTEYSFKRVHGAGDLIPRRIVIEVDITAATSLLKHAASLGFQHLVKGEIINILMLLGISPRGAHAVGVVELAKLLIKHVLSDATDDHVQELAAMEAAPTAGDILEWGCASRPFLGPKKYSVP